MNFVNTGFSAIGRLAVLGLMGAVFLFGMAGVVYMSLQGEEVSVPEITGKNLAQSEKELASLGLKIKKRADRFSSEAPNTVIEQIPKPGETVKTGQLILVVVSKGQGDVDQPASLKQNIEEDDAEKIEEMISDKPKKAKTNSNSNRKKADTARDVNANKSDSNSADSNSNKKESGSDNSSTDKPNKNTQPAANRPSNPKPAKGAVTDPPKKPVDRP